MTVHHSVFSFQLIQAPQPLPLATRFSEGDNRDWKNRSPAVEEKRKDQQFKETVKNSGGDWRDKDQERDGQSKEIAKSSGSDWRDKNQERDVQFKETVKSSGSDWRDKDQERDVRVSQILRQQDLGVDIP